VSLSTKDIEDICERCASPFGAIEDGVCSNCDECDGCGEWTVNLRDGWCVRCWAKYCSAEAETAMLMMDNDERDALAFQKKKGGDL